MSRATRRHPALEAKPAGRPARAPSIRPGGTRRPQAGRESRGVMAILRPRWAEEIVSELRKVTWPSREETWYLTMVVLVIAGIAGLFLGGVDIFFNWAINHTLLR
jgi:preprotein translocase SecE subunit